MEAPAHSSSSRGDAVYKRIYSSSKAAADVHHGLEAGAVGCSPHGRCWWETSPASAPSQRWAPQLRGGPAAWSRDGFNKSSLFSSQQTAASWRLRRWSCSGWRARRSSSPSRCSAECCRYAKSPPPGQTSPFPRATGASLRPAGTRSASCRATSSCGSCQWRLQTLGSTPVPTGTLWNRADVCFNKNSIAASLSRFKLDVFSNLRAGMKRTVWAGASSCRSTNRWLQTCRNSPFQSKSQWGRCWGSDVR